MFVLVEHQHAEGHETKGLLSFEKSTKGYKGIHFPQMAMLSPIPPARRIMQGPATHPAKVAIHPFLEMLIGFPFIDIPRGVLRISSNHDKVSLRLG